MMREWRRRGASRPWLLLRPGPSGWTWCLQAGDQTGDQGLGQAPQVPGARVALVVPGELCSHFQLPAPPGLKREEWPLLLEDRLLQGPEALDCACIGRPAGELRLLVVDRQRLDDWLTQCQAWGLEVERCWAEFQLPARPQAGQGWCWQRDDQALYARIADDGREQWLAWPQALDGCPWEPQAFAPIDTSWPSHWADLDALPGLRARRRPPVRIALTLAQRRAVAACAVLAAVWGATWSAQQWRQAQVYRQQVEAVIGAQSSPVQAARALRALQAASDEMALRLRRLEALQAQTQHWLQTHPQWRVRAVHYDGQRWQLQLEGEGAAPPWQEMAGAVGASWQLQGSDVVFDLGAGA